MTTIATKNGIIAFDSRRTRDNCVIITDNDDKSRKFTMSDGTECVAVVAGSLPDCEMLIKIFSGDVSSITEKHLNAEAFVLINGHVVHIGYENGSIWTQETCHEGDAIGSGAHFALTAFDYGADAEEAVKAAAQRDIFTGGVIRLVGDPN